MDPTRQLVPWSVFGELVTALTATPRGIFEAVDLWPHIAAIAFAEKVRGEQGYQLGTQCLGLLYRLESLRDLEASYIGSHLVRPAEQSTIWMDSTGELKPRQSQQARPFSGDQASMARLLNRHFLSDLLSASALGFVGDVVCQLLVEKRSLPKDLPDLDWRHRGEDHFEPRRLMALTLFSGVP